MDSGGVGSPSHFPIARFIKEAKVHFSPKQSFDNVFSYSISVNETNKRMSSGFLHKYFLNNSHKRLHKWLHYFDIYERHLHRFRDRASVMLEIGVKGGGSLAMWKEYLGPSSRVIGLDINPECKEHESDGVEVYIGSQDDPEIIEEIFHRYPTIDILLDDGSHLNRHMISSFERIYHRLHQNGVYIVEDTHTCYWKNFGGGLRRNDSFMEFAKHKIDELNAFHIGDDMPTTEFTRSTNFVAFYDSVVVFERRRQGQRLATVTKPMQ